MSKPMILHGEPGVVGAGHFPQEIPFVQYNGGRGVHEVGGHEAHEL